MRPLLSYALRSQAAALLFPVLVGLETFVLLNWSLPWRGDWMWTVEQVGLSLVLTSPLIAGVAAWDTATALAGSRFELVVSSPRPRTTVLRVWLTVFVVAAVAHLLALVAAGVVSARFNPLQPAPFVQVPVQFLGLAAMAGIGTLVGALRPRRMAALLAAAGGFAGMFVFGREGGHFSFLQTGGASIPMVGRRYDAGFLAAQVVVLGALTAVLVTARVGWHEGRRRLTPTSLVLVAAVVLGLGVAWRTGPVDNTRQVSLTAADYVCAGSAPRVCLSRAHGRYLASVSGHFTRVYAAARQAGLDADVLPERVVEVTASDSPPPGAVAFMVPWNALPTDRVEAFDVIGTIADPTHCPALSGEPPSERFRARQEGAIVWFMQVTGARWPQDIPYEAQPLSTAQVAAVLRDFAACRLDGIPQ